MQTYTRKIGFRYTYITGYTSLVSIVNACSAYVGTKGLNIQYDTNKIAFIPIVSNTNADASAVKVCMGGTTCALESLRPNAYFCATACSCAYVCNNYDPGTYITYIKGFTFCYRDPYHSCCPFATDTSYDVCLYTSGIGWKCMGSIACGCYQMTASTYQFANACISQWRCTGVYLFDDSYCAKIGNICTYMPSKPSAGQTSYCTTNCNGMADISILI